MIRPYHLTGQFGNGRPQTIICRLWNYLLNFIQGIYLGVAGTPYNGRGNGE